MKLLEKIERDVRISKFTKDELIIIMNILKTGRKYNDTKVIMVDKVIDYFNKILP
jgi:hypothetical protein